MEELTGKTTTHVVSAAPLGDEQIAALKDVLSRKTGKDIELSPSIDPSLIGGLYISVDGFVLDGTVKKQLRDMESSLVRGGRPE